MSSPAVEFDIRRWVWSNAAIGIASAVLMVAPFRAWYNIYVADCPRGGVGCRDTNRLGLIGGIAVHAYLWITFATSVAILVLLILRMLDRIAFLQSPNDRGMLACLTGLNLVLVLLAFLNKPGFSTLFSKGPAVYLPLPLPQLAVNWKDGAWMAIIAAAVAAVTAAVNLGLSWTQLHRR